MKANSIVRKDEGFTIEILLNSLLSCLLLLLFAAVIYIYIYDSYNHTSARFWTNKTTPF